MTLPDPDPSSQSDLIGEIVDEFVERVRAGESPGIEEFCARLPEHAEEIRRLLSALGVMESVRPALREELVESARSSRSDLVRVGPYRVLSEIGRGGMGVVYEAEHGTLGRRVALKVLAATGGTSAARFRREARAAAALHHTSIVPVFDVGEDGGQIFYAMQLIRGQSLDRVIDEIRKLRDDPPPPRDRADSSDLAPSLAHSVVEGRFRPRSVVAATEWSTIAAPPSAAVPPPHSSSATGSTGAVLAGSSAVGSRARVDRYHVSVADIGLQVAEALHYSHDRGVLHRDIKPSNLILDPDGVVWITDFGLAKAAEEDDLTHTGDLVGTLRYMSPERFAGTCDQRADVYGLGLTLYELLALKPAFEASTRATLIDAILHSSPRSLRTIDRRISTDLDTIISRAIDRDPSRRYADAAALAEDLRSWLEDRPISARRVSTLERAWRWARRNRALTASIILALVLLVALAIGSTIAAIRFRSGQIRESGLVTEMSELATRMSDLARDNARIAEEKGALAEANAALARRRERELYFADMLLAGHATTEPGGITRIAEAVDQWLPERTGSDLRGWEWYYLRSLSGNEEHVVDFGDEVFLSLSWNRHAESIALMSASSNVRIVSTRTWHQTTEVPRRSRLGAWSPDGTLLALVHSGRQVEIIDVDAMPTLAASRLIVLSGNVQSIDWSPDGDRLLVAASDGVSIVEVTTGTTLATFGGASTAPVREVRWTPDGRRIVTVDRGNGLTIRASDDGRVLAELPDLHGGGVLAMDFDPTSPVFASVDTSGKVALWDHEAAKNLGSSSLHSVLVWSLRWSPSGRYFATASADRTVAIWDAASGRRLRVLRGHTDAVHAVAWSEDERWVTSAGADGTLRVWAVEPRDDNREIPKAHASARGVRWSRRGESLASWGIRLGSEPGATIRDLANGGAVRGYDENEGGLFAFAWSADDSRFATGGDRTNVRLFDQATGRELARLDGAGNTIFDLDFSADDRWLAAASADRSVRIWDLSAEPPSLRATISVHSHRVNASRWSPDGTRLATASFDGTARVFSSDDFRELALYCSRETAKRLQSAAPVDRLRAFESDRSEFCWSLDWSPDGRYLAWSHGREIVVRDTTRDEGFRILSGHSSVIRSLDWSPDGARIASASDGGLVRLWSPTDAAASLVLGDGQGVLHGISWSSDGLKLAVAYGSGTLEVFDATIGHSREH